MTIMSIERFADYLDNLFDISTELEVVYPRFTNLLV